MFSRGDYSERRIRRSVSLLAGALLFLAPEAPADVIGTRKLKNSCIKKAKGVVWIEETQNGNEGSNPDQY